MSRAGYHIEKMARNHADPAAVSRYRIYELQYDGVATGREAIYISEHKPALTDDQIASLKGKLVGRRQLAIGAEPSKKQMRKPRYEPRYGATAVIKRLTREAGDGAWPEHLALKCFECEPGVDDDSGGLLRAAQATAKMYTDGGDVAACFAVGSAGSEKLFMLMPWGGDKDFAVTLVDISEGRQSLIPIVQLLKAFEKLLQRVERFHRTTGESIGDIKPKNLMPLYNQANELVDFMLVDMDGALAIDKMFTPEYLAEEDFEDMLSAGRIRPMASFKTDFHNLAAVLAQSVVIATAEKYLDYKFKRIEPAYVRDDGVVATAGRTVNIIKSNPLGANASARATDNIEARAVRWVWQKLSDGLNPVVVAPATGVSHTPLQYFICHDQMKYLIISDCNKLIKYFDREILPSSSSAVVAVDSPLAVATSAANRARSTRAFNRGFTTVAQQSQAAFGLVEKLSFMHMQMHQHLKEVTEVGATHFHGARLAIMTLLEPWQGSDPDLMRYIAEEGIFVDPFRLPAGGDGLAVASAAGGEADEGQKAPVTPRT
ncbi:MAG: hypothetical protein P1U63_08455 [Coxiellaceae bacterium]|nr:hypothetical protein [Coxiellaceae bacterium]